MLNIGPQELLVILFVALIIVGPKRLPELSRTIGRALRELRNAQDEVRRTIKVSLDDSAEPASRRSSGLPADRGAGDGGTSTDGGKDEPVEAESAEGGGVDPTAIARTLGLGLAELRRTREEIQRSFHVSLSDEPRHAPSNAAMGDPTPVPDEPASEG